MRLKRTKRLVPAWLLSKWFLAVVLVFFVLITVSLAREYYRSYQINNEIAVLQQEINSLQGQNTELSDFVEYLKTDRYFQEQARLKFGLKSPGEKVIVLKDDGSAVNESELSSEFEFTSSGKQKTNPSKWFAYFFSAR